MNNIQIGKSGEEIARKYLEKSGYKILGTNVRYSRFCELDIIALDRSTLVVVEVKTRRTNICGNPSEAVTKQKYNHIKQGLYMFLRDNPQYKKYRIDCISILLKPDLQIEHLKNI